MSGGLCVCWSRAAGAEHHLSSRCLGFYVCEMGCSISSQTLGGLGIIRAMVNRWLSA